MDRRIPFNEPFIVGKERHYIARAVSLGNIADDEHFTEACCRLVEKRFGVHKVLMTPSCTAALEMAAMLRGLEPDNEVILSSFTFVSTANAFVRLGAKPVFVDIRPDALNLDEDMIEAAVTSRTCVICLVHDAGTGCEMDPIMDIARRHQLRAVEDTAHRGRGLGSIGHLRISFRENKLFMCGEGGAPATGKDSCR